MIPLIGLWKNRSQKAVLEDEISGRSSAMVVSSPEGNSIAVPRHRASTRETLLDSPSKSHIQQLSVDMVVATVNGAPIRVPQLMPLDSGKTVVKMESRRLHSRLQRAIEAELVFQEAKAEGIEFTEAQKRRLDRIAPDRDAALEELAQYGLTWDTVNAAQLTFERELMEAVLLRQNLVSANEALAPSPDPASQALYEVALKKLLAQLKADAVVTVAPEVSL